ncbi:MAG: 3'-5' exonuclease [Spirochaetaceae bacterium]|nr:3'-5' exonuclease [Spirochaetaceae bacterium]
MRQNKSHHEYKKLPQLYQNGAVFCAIDTETTGINSNKDRIIEIGAILFDKNGIKNCFNELINPNCPIPLAASAVNHITDKMVVHCPYIDQILPKFIDFAKDSILVAHNACFDLKFINSELERCNLASLKNKTADTLQLSKKIFPEIKSHKLQSLADFFEIEVKQAHRAFDDARVCMEIFLRCINDIH